MKTLISFDGSTTSSGYTVFKVYEDKTFSYKESGVLKPPKPVKERKKRGEVVKKATKKDKKDNRKQEMLRRMDFFFDETKKLLLNEKSLGYIVFEDSYMGKDADAYKWLCRLHGFFMGYAKLNNLVCEALYPTHWRSIIGIPIREGKHFYKREEFKALSFKFYREVLGLDKIKDEDECESFLLGYSYLKEKGYTYRKK